MVESPFVKLLRTPYGYYFFDVNRNQIVKISKEMYEYLDGWINGKKSEECNEKFSDLMQMGYLSSAKVESIEHPYTSRVTDEIKTKMKMLILQLTQNCNLRCSYCIYSTDYNPLQRSHNGKRMDPSIATKALDYFMQHSEDVQQVFVSFYGGEPLLEFSLIQYLLEYVKRNYPARNVVYSFTTNATLLTPSILDFCDKNNIAIMISLDGTENIHNISRRYASDGKGSFSKVISNIEYIKQYYPNIHKNMLVNMVYDEQNDYDEICDIFDDERITGISKFMLSGIDDKYSIEKAVRTYSFREKEEYHNFLGWIEYIKNDTYSGKNCFVKEKIAQLSSNAEKFKAMPDLAKKMAPSGPCMAGKTKLFVNVYGDFFPCERVSEQSEYVNIGNIETGINVQKVIQLLNIGKISASECKKCWGIRHCKLCASHVDNCGKASRELKLSFCENVKNTLEEDIRDYIANKEAKMLWKKRLN